MTRFVFVELVVLFFVGCSPRTKEAMNLSENGKISNGRSSQPPSEQRHEIRNLKRVVIKTLSLGKSSGNMRVIEFWYEENSEYKNETIAFGPGRSPTEKIMVLKVGGKPWASYEREITPLGMKNTVGGYPAVKECVIWVDDLKMVSM